MAIGKRPVNWLIARFELARNGVTGNVRPMEGLRGFAVFLVFLVHYVTLVKPWTADTPALQAVSRAMHSAGNTGVDLFFVLSGLLIYGSLIARAQNFFIFMGRRIERIYPAYVVVLALYLALSFLFPSESKFPATSWSSGVYFLQNYLLLPGLFPIEPIVTVAWSLSYEMFFYLSIPLAIAALGLRNRTVCSRITLFLITAAAMLVYCAGYGGHVRLTMFLAGMVLYEALGVPRERAPRSLWALLALVLGLSSAILFAGSTTAQALKVGVIACAFFLLCFTCFANPYGAAGRFYAWTPMRWLGNMSYSYYLIHGLALKGAFLFLAFVVPATPDEPILFWVLLVPMFAITLVPSAALFLLIERPLSLAPSAARASHSRFASAR